MYVINKNNCVGCGHCINNCPVEAISFDENMIAHIDQEKCIHCGTCINICPMSAIEEKEGK